MAVVNKKALADLVSEKKDITKKEAAEVVDAVFEAITESLKKGEKVDITGFGKFEVKERAARVGINPQTKEQIQIPATKVPGFKASKSLKDEVR